MEKGGRRERKLDEDGVANCSIGALLFLMQSFGNFNWYWNEHRECVSLELWWVEPHHNGLSQIKTWRIKTINLLQWKLFVPAAVAVLHRRLRIQLPQFAKSIPRTVFSHYTIHYSMSWLMKWRVQHLSVYLWMCTMYPPESLLPISLPLSLHLQDIFHEWKYDKLFGSSKFYSMHILHTVLILLYWDNGISQTKPFRWNKGLQRKPINGKILRKSTRSLNCFMNM